MSAPRPTPSVMAGRTDPALRVRPVDYSTWKPSQGGAPADDAAPPSTGTASAGQGGTARNIPGSRDRTASPAPAAHRDRQGVPKPGPGPREAGRAASSAEEDGLRTVHSRLTLDPVLLRMLEDLRAGLRPRTSAPEAALYTVTSETPDRPQLDVPHSGVEVQGLWDVTEADLQRTVADPEDTWTADLGRTDYYVRDQLCVHVVRARHQVIGIYRSGWALARRPDETWADTPGHLDKQGAKPGGGGTRYPTNRRELLARLRQAGFHVTTSGPTHGKITHPEVPGRFLPFSSTPSSRRYGRHVVTAVNRVFGVDLRG